jgi:multidrug efflux pump subunit AcrA (membrane-fusion protein)
MRMRRLSILFTCLIAMTLIIAACGKKQEATPPPTPRPVETVILESINPIKPLQLTGAVKAWKESNVAFEINGRVDFIVDTATNLRGRWMVGEKAIVQGDPLARLDTRSYRIQRDTAKAAVNVARGQLATAEVELEKVLPARLEAAKAERARAQADYVRYAVAGQRNAVAKTDVDRALADRDVKVAAFKKVLADIEAQRTRLKGHHANVAEAKANLADAEYDLERCTLYAPFNGEVAEVWTEAGGYARTGNAVAHLIMMDPIKIDVSVSAEVAQRVQLQQVVNVYISGQKKPMYGSVFEKATVADADTRTFRISIMVRNKITHGEIDLTQDRFKDLPHLTKFSYLQRERPEDPTSIYVVEENRALRKDGKGHYVWAAESHKQSDAIDWSKPILKLKKYRVVPGTKRINFQGLWLAIELKDIGDLKEGALIALDVPKSLKDGDEMLIARKQWLLRPGQMVNIYPEIVPPPPGFYLPLNVIRPIDDQNGDVFVVADNKARKVRVKLLRHAGELMLVAPANEEGKALIKGGVKVVASHIHFLKDGEPLRVVRTERIKP